MIHVELKILFHLPLKLELNTFMSLFFTLFTTHIPPYGPSIFVKITPQVLTETVNKY